MADHQQHREVTRCLGPGGRHGTTISICLETDDNMFVISFIADYGGNIIYSDLSRRENFHQKLFRHKLFLNGLYLQMKLYYNQDYEE